MSAETAGAIGALVEPEDARPALSIVADTLTETPPVAVPRLDARPRVGRNFATLASGQMVTWTMTLLWTLVVPRVLGPEGFGVVTTVLAVTGFFGVLQGIGTRNYMVRELVTRPADAPKLVGTAIVLRLLLAPIVAVGVVVLALAAHYGHEETIALYLASVVTVATLVTDPLASMFQSIEQMKYLALSDVVNKTAQSVLGIAIATAGLGAIGITANMAVFAVVVLGLNVLWLRPYLRVDLRTNARMVVGMARGSASFFAAGLFYTFYLWIDTIMLSVMTNTKVVGWYGVGTTVFQTLLFLSTVMSTAYLPRLVASFRDGRDGVLMTARKPLDLLIVAALPIAGGIAMAGTAIVHVLYGGAYAEAVVPLVILGFSIPPTYVNIILSQALIAQGRQMVCTWLMVGATLFNPLANLILIPLTQSRYHNGAIGAAIALVLTETVQMVAIFVIVGRHAVGRRTLGRWARVAIASAGMWAAAFAARPLGTPVSLAVGVATLVVLFLALRVPTEQEMNAALAGLRRVAHAARLRGRVRVRK